MTTTTGRRLSSAVTSLAGASLIAAGVAFLSNVLTARTLGPELRGHVAFVLQSAYFVAPLLIFGGDRATLRAARSEATDLWAPRRRHLVIASVSATAVCLLVFRDWNFLIGPAASATAWLLLRRAHVAASGGYRAYFRPFVLFQAGILAFHLLLFLVQEPRWQWWVAPYVVPALFFLTRRASSHELSGAPSGNIPFVSATLTQMWSLRGERILLPLIAGPSALGSYVVVATATEPLYWVAQAIADHRVSENPPTSARRRLEALLTTCGIFTAGAAALAVALWYLLVPVFGPEFKSARELVLPLAVAAVALAAYRQSSGWVLAGSRPQSLGVLEGAVAVVAVAVYPISILIAGAQGAAWGTVLVYGVGALLGFVPWFYRPVRTT